MKSLAFNSVLLFLVALLPFAFAQDYAGTTVSTFFSTKTVYLVHTETMTGTPPASTSSATSSNATSIYTPTSYGTSIPTLSSVANYNMSSTGAYYPTGTGSGSIGGPTTTGAVPTFTGAASHLNANALLAALAAGVGYLAL